LADHLKLPGGSDGLRSDLEQRLTDHVLDEGGWDAMVATGTLSDKKLLALLGLDFVSTPSKSTPRSSSRSRVRSRKCVPWSSLYCFQ
jgi:hypothetical protein